MSGNSNQKIKLLHLLDIFKKYSDEQNPLTTNDIIQYLEKVGVESERQIIDKFGDDIYIRNEPDNKNFFVSTKAFDSDGLIGWLLQFGGDIEVVSPQSLRDKLLEKIKNLREIYKI